MCQAWRELGQTRPDSAHVQLKLPACEQGVQIMSYHRAAPAAVPGKPQGRQPRPAAPGDTAIPSRRGTPESAINPFNPPNRRRGTAYDAFTSDVPATRAVMKPRKDV
ncbi:hypothetical protein C3475_28810 [Mycobacterium kansasii]|nr:hypothetical protein B1T46_29930 [Mycobacterium kansasii]POX68729.1 hypothetical protein C3475_28810 [Mycobacterium kansasii]POX68810.1 hypothetical protein C3470_28550 [Mycobacterium kansasii]